MSNLSLYKLSSNYMRALDALTDPEADIPAEVVADTLEGLEGELQEKAVNVAKFMRNMEAMSQAIKEAEAQMARRRKAIEGRVKCLKDYLKENMEACGISKIESPWFRLAVQKNPAAVDVVDEAALPDEFKEQVVTVKIDKAAIRDALKAGVDVPGAALVQGTRMVVR
jgi:hypothetical protein